MAVSLNEKTWCTKLMNVNLMLMKVVQIELCDKKVIVPVRST